MKSTICILSLCLTFIHTGAQAEIIEDIWNKYSPVISEKETIEDVWTRYCIVKNKDTIRSHTPGRIIGELSPEQKKYFEEAWTYRHSTYELYFASSAQLAESVYDLALFAKDIDKTLPKEKFIKGVLGFHYGKKQVCDWANSIWNANMQQTAYPSLIQFFLKDKVLTLTDQGFVVSANIQHILAASKGKKKSFLATLRHERLHVFWDEDEAFRNAQITKWTNLPEKEKAQIRKELYRYAQSNEQQLIEEWAVHKAEKNRNTLYLQAQD